MLEEKYLLCTSDDVLYEGGVSEKFSLAISARVNQIIKGGWEAFRKGVVFSFCKDVFFPTEQKLYVYYVYYSANVTDLRDALKIPEETKALPFVTMKGTLRPLLRKTDVDLPGRAEFSLNGHVN